MAKERESASLLKSRILETTEVLLRRYGAAKLSVIDVARDLDMSHGNIYRFFPSKADLLAAIAQQWLEEVLRPLTEICAEKIAADKKLTKWFEKLRQLKRDKFLQDPQLFAIYVEIAEQARDEVQLHIEAMVGQIASIIDEGIKAKIFKNCDAHSQATLLLRATAVLHHPHFVASPDYPSDGEARKLTAYVIDGLKRQ
jgi:AcrR family transcriptional regulator